MPSDRIRVAGWLLVATLLAGACAGGREDSPAIEGVDRFFATSSTTTSTTTTTTSTTLAPPSTVPPIPLTQARAVTSPAGVVVPVLGPYGDGVKVGTPCGNEAVVTSGTPHQEVAVVLDAGHGGSENGAVDPRGQGFTEKVVNLAVARHAADALAAKGISTLMTRTGDYRSTLSARARLVQTVKPRAFVSVHHNGDSDGPRDGPGTETYYQVDSPTTAGSKRLAGLIYEEVVKALSQYPGIAWQADRDAGAKYRLNARGGDYYGILRRAKGVTAVLAELAFLSNPPERDLLTRPDVQKAEGAAVARGIERYLTTNDPGSGYVEPYPRDTPAGGGGGSSGCVDPPL